ncbi:hypothetical protein WOLCODRAFT_167215 [Wolfiporia cocos MD-104 SS10]|uniref:Uncharacterized protein n=1 Tax=Wolfiporia cocos (strain MD-104) TaxID=742152 RepID=A0A2H3J3W0_WOLCO|nr:hypothetical protein WOLCODRAFT_167215 [Wolfiporia cocos MD-104 SS10]
MSTQSADVERRIDKGKARARATEDTPLLGSASGTSRTRLEDVAHTHRLVSGLLSVFFVTLSLCIVGFVLVVLIIFTYRSRAVSASPDELIQHALVVKGPDRVDVLNTTGDGGIWVMVHGRLGFDAGDVAGVNAAEEDSFILDVWKSLGRWGIRRLDRVSVNLSTVAITPAGDPGHGLATLSFPPLEVPLTANPPRDSSWLTPVALPVLIRPTKDVKTMMRFARNSWRDGMISVHVEVLQATVQGGAVGEESWRSYLKFAHSDIHTAVHISIPKLPGLPPPTGPLPDFAQLVTLQSFRITTEYHALVIDANATMIDPAPADFNMLVPSLPFVVSLLPYNSSDTNSSDTAPPVPIAAVHTQPFTLTRPNVSLSINGTVLPLAHNASGTLSAFLGNYVSARDSPVLLSTPLFPQLFARAVFPAPRPKPSILRDVAIRDMKIRPLGAGMVASGTVRARVVLPRGIEVGLDVARVFPDVLVYDGEVPSELNDELQTGVRVLNFPVDDGDRDVPPAPPLPDPLPPRAFAHIRPDNWLPSLSEPSESGEGEGSAVSVEAKIVDVPLEVLPGREREFSNFVSKVVFGSQGALAGVQGVAAVAVNVHGLPFENGRDSEMELTGLPFQGSVRIGKRTLLNGL